jgi:hypothetical protein
MSNASGWRDLWRHHRRELWLLAPIAGLVLIPWLGGVAAAVWLIAQQGWAWYWWVGCVVLITIGFWLLRSQLSRPRSPRIDLTGRTPGASSAERQARQALRRRARTVTADDLRSQDSIQDLIQDAFHAVAQAYSPGDQAALWRFTLPELLLMVEDFAQRLRATLLDAFPLARHIELSWVVRLSDLADPAGRWYTAWRLLRWVNPTQALLAEVRDSLSKQAFTGFGETAKAQIGVILVEQAGEAAIKLYSGAYRRRADELSPTAPEPITDTPPEPLTILLAGRRNAGKSALLNALLGRAKEPVGLLTATTEDCRAYEFESADAGQLILVDCPGADGKPKEPWLEQAKHSDLVLWIAAANRADRAADQRALAALDALTDSNPALRPITRVLVLTHADKLDPPAEWTLPYDLEQGQGQKEQQMRDAREAACEQLAMPPQHCALIAIRPGEPLWNRGALEQAIAGVLPEAQQKQLERGLARDGWFKTAKDVVVSVPTVYEKAVKVAGRMVGQLAGKTARKG